MLQCERTGILQTLEKTADMLVAHKVMKNFMEGGEHYLRIISSRMSDTIYYSMCFIFILQALRFQNCLWKFWHVLNRLK